MLLPPVVFLHAGAPGAQFEASRQAPMHVHLALQDRSFFLS